MLKGRVIVIPLVTRWDWTADYIRQTARVLSKENIVIIYDYQKSTYFLKARKSESVVSESENIIFVAPLYYIPGRRFQIIETLNKKLSMLLLLLKFIFKQKIVWIFDPEFYYLASVPMFRKVTIYDCVDYHSSLDPLKENVIRSSESKLLSVCDHFFVNSHVLETLHKTNLNPPHYISAQGFFIPKLSRKTSLVLKGKGTKPIIGFVGGINYRLDFSLLYQLIANNSQWQFVFWGPLQQQPFEDALFHTTKWIKKIKACSNVQFGQSNDREEVYSLIEQFDIAMIPYNVEISFNKFCYPMKLFEYFYLGKPVISTPIQELCRKDFDDLVMIKGNILEWQAGIKSLVGTKWPQQKIQRQRELAILNSWDRKVDEISGFIEHD